MEEEKPTGPRPQPKEDRSGSQEPIRKDEPRDNTPKQQPLTEGTERPIPHHDDD